jgi:uncharacterized membrane protein YedE/YeeE
MDWLNASRWSPYIAGIGIGILSWIALLVSDRTIGCSTPIARTSGMIERIFRGDKVLQRPYFQEYRPVIGWDWMLIVGVLAGALLSAVLSGAFTVRWVPGLWQETFGNTPLLRVLVAFVGGILMGIGSRWGGGCTSGHGISGTLQLAVSSWIAVIGFFVSGIAAAVLIFRVIGG